MVTITKTMKTVTKNVLKDKNGSTTLFVRHAKVARNAAQATILEAIQHFVHVIVLFIVVMVIYSSLTRIAHAIMINVNALKIFTQRTKFALVHLTSTAVMETFGQKIWTAIAITMTIAVLVIHTLPIWIVIIVTPQNTVVLKMVILMKQINSVHALMISQIA